MTPEVLKIGYTDIEKHIYDLRCQFILLYDWFLVELLKGQQTQLVGYATYSYVLKNIGLLLKPSCNILVSEIFYFHTVLCSTGMDEEIV